jgi:hypothetical protein
MSLKKQNGRKKILLIDEVDVFFNKDFYGNHYKPLASLKDSTISELINYCWDNKKDLKNFALV